MLAGRDDDGREGKATVYYTAHEVNEANEYVRSQFQDVLSRKELNIKSLRVGVRMRVNVRMICQKIRVFDQLTHVVGDEFSAALLAPVDRSSGVDLPPVVEVTFGIRGGVGVGLGVFTFSGIFLLIVVCLQTRVWWPFFEFKFNKLAFYI